MKKILAIIFFCSLKLYGELPYIIPDYPINENFKHLDYNKQDLGHKIYTTVPTTDNIGEGQFVGYYSGTDYRIYVKINGNITYFSPTPIGTVITYVSTTPPAGYLYCNGQSVSTTTYSALFDIIAYQYGGSGTSFNLPDYRGFFLRGMADGSAIDPDRTARKRADGTFGDVIGSTQAYQIQSHVHEYQTVPGAGGVLQGGANYDVGAANTVATGGNETRPVNTYVAYHIKY